MSEKEKQWKKDFLVKSSNILIAIRNALNYLILFLSIKTRFLYMFLQLVKDEMWPTITLTYQGDLGDPNFNCIAIVIPRFS